VKYQFLDNNGQPLEGGFLHTYLVGTSDETPAYSDHTLETPHENPIELDSSGRATIFWAAVRYKLVLKDADGVTIWTVDGFADEGRLLRAFLGQAVGDVEVDHGYTIQETDHLVTVHSTGTDPAVINLPPADERTTPIIIKNVHSIALAVTPASGDEIEGSTSAFTVPAASGTDQPSITLLSDGESSWYIAASHLVP
jgi:hypothetical protein